MLPVRRVHPQGSGLAWVIGGVPTAALLVVFALLAIAIAIATPAAAESPSEVVAGTADNGVFVALGLGDEAMFEPIVQKAAEAGLDFAVVEALAPEPDPDAFALRVLQASEHDVVALIGPSDRIWLQAAEIEDRDLLSARRAAQDAASPAAALDIIVTELTTETEPGRPEILDQLQRVALALVALILLGTIADQLIRRLMASRRQRTAST